jgi:hypothetical protein
VFIGVWWVSGGVRGLTGFNRVVDEEFHESLAGGSEGVEVRWEWDAAEFPLELGSTRRLLIFVLSR